MGNYARAVWTLAEPIHAITYFAPEAQQAYADAGLTGFWRGYFAGRAAPLGAIGAPPVTAMFAGFAPGMVERALPSVWSLISPADALAARQRGAVAALRRLVPDAAAVEAAAGVLQSAVGRLEFAGRPLGAANQALPVPDEPYAQLWQAATTLREHRGDGHVAALVAAGIAGLDALVLRSGIDLGAVAWQQVRGWTEAEWDAATARLIGSGLLDTRKQATVDGLAVMRLAEQATDFAAGRPWHGAEDAVVAGLILAPVARACAEALPYPNPIGLLAQWDASADPSAVSISEIEIS